MASECLFHDTHFNSQPHEEADKAQAGGGRHGGYFNSQPHEEADNKHICKEGTPNGISTHSLTRRLTIDSLKQELNEIISTHSLTRRLTALYPKKPQVHRHFNSQPHEEADNHIHSILDKHCVFQLTASRGG